MAYSVRCHVPTVKNLLFANTAGHANDVTGTIIDDNNTGLKLLRSSGFRYLGQICVYLINLILNLHIDGRVDMVSASLNQMCVDTLLFLLQIVPHKTITLSKESSHIFHNRIHEPGIYGFGSIFADKNLLFALRTVIV